MRVYISVDMEGIAGVVHESQTDPTTPAFAAEYARFRRLMTAEANAAVEGALAAGATRVLVNDSHWFMRNLLAEELHQSAELVSGDPKPRSMMQEIDQQGGFDAALFIGYHARAGTRNAILDHTYADRIHEVRLNGKPVGELGLNAGVAGVHGVPVALVTGDSALAVACRMIREEVQRALKGRHAPYIVRTPVTLEVDFAMTIHADMAELCPGATRTGGRTVAFTHPEYGEVFRAWRTLLNLSGAV